MVPPEGDFGGIRFAYANTRPPYGGRVFIKSVDTLSEIWNQLEAYVFDAYALIKNANPLGNNGEVRVVSL
jgi:hypothetical protein